MTQVLENVGRNQMEEEEEEEGGNERDTERGRDGLRGGKVQRSHYLFVGGFARGVHAPVAFLDRLRRVPRRSCHLGSGGKKKKKKKQ